MEKKTIKRRTVLGLVADALALATLGELGSLVGPGRAAAASAESQTFTVIFFFFVVVVLLLLHGIVLAGLAGGIFVVVVGSGGDGFSWLHDDVHRNVHGSSRNGGGRRNGE